MERDPQGYYRTVATASERFQAFIPSPLPPVPPLVWSPELRQRFDDALVALGRLDAVSAFVPNARLLLYSFIRKEAVLSSQIEGTQSSLADLLLYEIDEAPGVPVEDTIEVSRYLAALERGLRDLKSGLPLCVRMLCNVHKALMNHRGGRSKTPGEIRRSQVWLGGTRPGNAAFVPPPADALPDCLSNLEKFLNDQPEPTSPLIKAAIAHVQFETIHPFLDGNGRVGRLLIVLQLVADGVLREPMVYPSLYFRAHRTQYYDLLNAVRLTGDWERWLDFFAEAIRVSATQGVSTANGVRALLQIDRAKIKQLGRAAESAMAVHELLQRQPLTTTGTLVKMTGLTPATVNKTLQNLMKLGIVREITNRLRGRIFSYTRYMTLLNRGVESSRTAKAGSGA